MILEDDQSVFPAAGNPVFVTDQATVDEAGPDYQETIELVQEGLTHEVMQELNARVDIDREEAGRGRDPVPPGGGLHRVVHGA